MHAHRIGLIALLAGTALLGSRGLAAASAAPGTAPPPPVRPALESPAEPLATEGEASPSPEIIAARDRLVEQLERAAAAGLISLDGQLPGRRTGSSGAPASRPAPEPRRAPVASPEVERRFAEPPRSQPEPALRGSDGTDLAVAADRVQEEPSPDRPAPQPVCLSDADLALYPTPSLEAARRPLLAEFDEPDPGVVRARAKRWIVEGRGLEAVALIEDLVPEVPWAGPLTALARILEGEPLPFGHALDVDGCDGHHALWQAAAEAQAGNARKALGLAELGRPSIQSIAPDVLHRLSIELVRAAVDLEEWEAARRWLAFARRGRVPGALPDPRLLLMEARLAASDGRSRAALDRLVALRAQGGPEGRIATVLLAQAIADGQVERVRVGHALRLDLGAIAFSESGSALGEQAIVAEARLGARAYGKEGALDLLALARSSGQIGARAYRDAVTALTRDAVAHIAGREETPLAILVERAPERFAEALAEPQFRAALARSYGRIGLPEKGEARLQPDDLADGALAEDLAEAYLAAGLPTDAARLARRLPDGPARALLQVRAAEDPGRALALLDGMEIDDPDKLARVAWAAGDWERAAEALRQGGQGVPDNGSRKARLAVAQSRATPRDDADGTLPPTEEADAPSLETEVRDLLEASRQDLDLIRKVLGDG